MLSPDIGGFSDPFAVLSQEQLQDVGYVVRVRRLISEEKLAADGDDAREAQRITQRLLDHDIHIDWLLAQREFIRLIRESRSRALAQTVAQKHSSRPVMLAGYVIPIAETDGRVTEFFLVPSLAACSHASAPPENQLVYVHSPQGIEVSRRITPARVVGLLQATPLTRWLPSVDGRKRYTAGYQLEADSVETAARTSPGRRR